MTEVANTESAEPVDASAAEPDDPQAVDASTEEASVDTPDREPSDSGALSASQQANVRRLIQQRDQQWQDWTRQQQNQQNQQTQTASEAAVLDELTTEIRGYYTDDEVGQKTFETIEKHLKKRLGSGERVTMQDVRNVAAQEAGNVRNQVRSGVAITNEVKALVTEGVISTASEQRIVEAEYTARLDDPQMAQAASTPQGAEMILKGVVYDLIKGKKIKPGAKPKAPVNPLSSGGNGSPSRPVKSESLDPSKSPFASVRAMSEDDVKAAANTSHSHFSGAANG